MHLLLCGCHFHVPFPVDPITTLTAIVLPMDLKGTFLRASGVLSTDSFDINAVGLSSKGEPCT